MLLNKERAYRIMEKYEVEAIIAAMPENVTYLTDFWSLSHWILKGTPTFAVLPRDRRIEPFIATPISELDQAAMGEGTGVKDFSTFGTFYVEVPEGAILAEEERKLKNLLNRSRPRVDAVAALIESLKERGLVKGKMALDQMNLTANLHAAILKNLPGVEVIDGYPLLREIRAVKTAEEIGRLEKSASKTEKAFLKAVEVIREGVTELEIARAFHDTLAAEGAIPVIACVGAGYRSAFPNVIPSTYRVKKGDLIRFDIGCLYKYYYSDTARIAILGKPTQKQRIYYDAILFGEDRAFSLIRPGARASDIFHEAVKAVREKGIPHYKRGHVGHGIGIECYDIPVLNPASDHILEEGMVVNVETPYYELGFGGLQVEDTLAVTRDGYRLLTQCQRGLFVL